jgi:hypothetical protein
MIAAVETQPRVWYSRHTPLDYLLFMLCDAITVVAEFMDSY